MGYRFLTLDREGRRTTLTLDRPPLNVLHLGMLEELEGALKEVEAQGVHCLVLRGKGKAFSAGVDVADHTEDRVAGTLRSFHAVLLRLVRLEGVTVAQVHGACLGGGMELAMACDLVYAAEDAVLGQPEISLASFPPFGAALYPRRVGLAGAAEVVLLGRKVSAGRAAELGFLNGVAPEAELAARVGEVCATLESYSGPALALAKRALRAGWERGLERAVSEAERLYLEELMATRDAKEGVAAFLEKRTPVWEDR